jgi:hypothetical protein
MYTLKATKTAEMFGEEGRVEQEANGSWVQGCSQARVTDSIAGAAA